MPAYVVVNVEVHDQERYEKYKDLAPASIAAHGGRYLARGGQAEVLEGAYQPRRFVILEFPTVERAKTWWACEGYSRAKALRQASATTDMILVEGLAPKALA